MNFTSPNKYLLDKGLGLVDNSTDWGIPTRYIWDSTKENGFQLEEWDHN